MSAAAQIDYRKLAAQYGGTPAEKKETDYAALAAEFGGQPASTPSTASLTVPVTPVSEPLPQAPRKVSAVGPEKPGILTRGLVPATALKLRPAIYDDLLALSAKRAKLQVKVQSGKGTEADRKELEDTDFRIRNIEGLTETLSSFTSPVGIATLGVLPLLGKVPQLAAATYFAAQGAEEATRPPEIDEPPADIMQRRLGGAGQVAMSVPGIRSSIPPAAGAMTKGAQAVASVARAARHPFKTITQMSPKELAELPPAAAFQPALANTRQEIIDYATQNKINLTPYEATGNRAMGRIQAVGERSLVGGKQLEEMRLAEAHKVIKNVESIATRNDPHRLGISEESAGEHIRRTVETSRDVAHENASNAYKQAAIDQADLAGDLKPLLQFAAAQQFRRQPHAAQPRRIYHSKETQAALDDIGGKRAELGPRPSVESLRNLRSEFLEKSRVVPGESMTNAQRLYSRAADIVDTVIIRAAKGTPFEATFRDASKQWKQLKQTYDERGTTFHRILSTKDPGSVTRLILARRSAADINAMRKANMEPALEAVRRQVLSEISRRAFRVQDKGLGGYSQGFLRALFGDAGTKELYLNGELVRRMNFQANPSGTSDVLLTASQIMIGPKGVLPTIGGMAAAAKFSKPRPAAEFKK